MSLLDKISQDIKTAMLAKDKEKLFALRDIKAKLLLEATSGHGEVTEDIENKVIVKMYKQRMESYEIYKQQNREDLAAEEMAQAKVIEEYMPKMMSEDEIKAKVTEVISLLGASGPQDMGKVMGKITKELAGKADGKIIAEIVKATLRN